jgi:2-polyprenyl-3-methyl-5-hydroxy-6-metoxy-1,4-benzoquinol methylase
MLREMEEGFDKIVYGAVNKSVLERVPLNVSRICDVGCGDGSFGLAIKSRQAAYVHGLTYSSVEADKAKTKIDYVSILNLNNLEEISCHLSSNVFDCIVCSHVLEHLNWPTQVLLKLTNSLANDGVLIVALPNVLAWRQRLLFLIGYFRYTEGGIMDETHFRFFDFQSAINLVREAGFSKIEACGHGVFPLSKYLPLVGKYLDRIALSIFPGLFSTQFLIVAKK